MSIDALVEQLLQNNRLMDAMKANIAAHAAQAAQDAFIGPQLSTLLERASIPSGMVDTPVVTALPVGGKEGDVVVYLASNNGNGDATARVVPWMLMCLPRISNAYPWHFIGGLPAYQYVAAQENTASGSPTTLTTLGPDLVAPLAGDYRLDFGASIQNNSAAADTTVAMAPSVAGSTPVEADGLAVFHHGSPDAVQADCSTFREYEGLAAQTTFAMRYWRSFGATSTGYYRGRYAALTPIRVGRT